MNASKLLILMAGVVGLSACEATELTTPDAGSCEGLEGQNRWPWYAADPPQVGADEIGFERGDTAPDFQLVDQFGEPTCLWQMAGKVVIVDASALWCEPCKEIAKHASCVADSYGDDLVYVTFIGQNNSFLPAEYPDNVGWAESYGLDQGSQTPVFADGGQLFARTEEWVSSFPSFMLLDTDMTIVAKEGGVNGENTMRDAATGLLGEPSSDCKDEEEE